MNAYFCCPSSHPAPRWAAHGLSELGHDIKYFTSFALPSRHAKGHSRTLAKIGRELDRKRLPNGISAEHIINCAPMFEIIRVATERVQLFKINKLLQRLVNTLVQRRIINYVQKNGKPDAIFATGSLSRRISEYAYREDIPLVLYLPQPLMKFVDTIAPGESSRMRPDEKIGAAEVMASVGFLASSRLVERSIKNEVANRPVIRHPLGFSSSNESDITPAARTRVDPQSAFRLLFVGRASHQKNIPALLVALRDVSSEISVSLTIVTPDLSKVARLVTDNAVEDLVDIVPTMNRTDLNNLMRMHDSFVLPSFFEGYGLVIVEALANGLPVITTPYTAGGDLDIHDRAGIIVPPGSSAALAGAISRLALDPGLTARFSVTAERLTESLSWDDYAKNVSPQLEALLSSLQRP